MCHAGRDLTFYISIVYALKIKMTLRSTSLAWPTHPTIDEFPACDHGK